MVCCSQLRFDLILCSEICPEDVDQLTVVEWVWAVVLGLLCCDGRRSHLLTQSHMILCHVFLLFPRGEGLGYPCNILLVMPVWLYSPFELLPHAQTVGLVTLWFWEVVFYSIGLTTVGLDWCPLIQWRYFAMLGQQGRCLLWLAWPCTVVGVHPLQWLQLCHLFVVPFACKAGKFFACKLWTVVAVFMTVLGFVSGK